MKHYVVRPRSGKGWLLTLAFVVLIAAGIWPVIGLFNRAQPWLGLPPIAVWTYVIVLGCWLVMLIANRCIKVASHDD
ncbi:MULTISPECIES: hypothetical protein [Salinicola]|uniref:DUF3311 domain-containing protein n=1 Tax=Salinicola socius TaxID=404433 RepID=A0A1Q8SR40_9GAMM|nr:MULTISPECIES: hypothetical protein [Salinicola]OLO03873.1 hypothetical protein BTW07_11300 [Salinicola socius]